MDINVSNKLFDYYKKSIIIFVFLFCHSSYGDGTKIVNYANQYIGITEKSNRNDGEPIETWQKFSGGEIGQPYCTYFTVYCHWQTGYTNIPKTGWTPSLDIPKYRITLYNIKSGDVMLLYFPKLGRVGHSGIFYKQNGNYWLTIEANTSADSEDLSSKSREGDGVFRRRRSIILLKNSNNRFVRYWDDAK